MDLDLVVVGPLDDFFTYGAPDEVVLARNPNTPAERLGQTSLFRFPVGKLLPLQEKFLADPQGVADAYKFEQRFVTREAPGGVRFWPGPWVRHFRMHCVRTLPLNFFLPPKLPEGHPRGDLPRRPPAAARHRRPLDRRLPPLDARPSTCAASSPPTAPTRRSATSATIFARRPGWRRPGASRARYPRISASRAKLAATPSGERSVTKPSRPGQSRIASSMPASLPGA